MIQQLWRGLAAFILLLTGAGVLIYFGLQRQDQTIHLVVRRLQPLAAANLRVRSDFSTSQAILQAYILTGETRLISYYESARRDFTAAVARAYGLATGSARSNVALQRLEATRWYGYADKMQLLAPGSASLVRLANGSLGSASTFYLANQALHDRLAAQTSVALSTGQRDLDTAVAWSGALAGLALLLGLVAAAGTIRGITRALAGLTATMRRLSAGDHTARAGLTGAAETRQVALSLNELADEADRLHAQEAKATQLREMAREAGLRIRENLRADDVISAARGVLETRLDTDVVYLHLIEDGRVSLPVGHDREWLFGSDFVTYFSRENLKLFDEFFREAGSLLTQDVQGEEGDLIPAEIRGPLRQAGVASVLLTPFGVESAAQPAPHRFLGVRRPGRHRRRFRLRGCRAAGLRGQAAHRPLLRAAADRRAHAGELQHQPDIHQRLRALRPRCLPAATRWPACGLRQERRHAPAARTQAPARLR